VQGIVSDWSQALSSDDAPEEQLPARAGAEEVLAVESPSLFARAHVAHERALKRGSLAVVRAPL